jgi:hypothetical protein
MDIISRDSALHNRDTCYFTGKPCKRGHISPRYVKNCACTACLHPVYTTAQSAERVKLTNQKSAMKDSLTLQGFTIHPDDLEIFISTLLLYSQIRYPELIARDLTSRRKSISGGPEFRTYYFRAHLEDRPKLVEMEKSLASRRNDLEQARRASEAFDKAMGIPQPAKPPTRSAPLKTAHSVLVRHDNPRVTPCAHRWRESPGVDVLICTLCGVSNK